MMKVVIIQEQLDKSNMINHVLKDILEDDIHVIYCRNSLIEILKVLDTNDIDLLILDLNFKNTDVFELLNLAKNRPFQTVVLSEDETFAIHAYNNGILDYVIKPIAEQRFEQAIRRFRDLKINKDPRAKYLVVKKRKSISFIPMDDIVYVKGADVYTELFLKDGTSQLHHYTLARLDKILSHSFVRVHRSFLVKMSEIIKITISSGSKYIALLHNGEKVPVSRTRYKKLKAGWG